jgi:hypothetical protein
MSAEAYRLGNRDVSFFDHGGTIVYPSGTRGAIISFALAAGIVALASAPAIGATRQIPSSGTTTLQAGPPGVDGIQNPEIPPGLESDEGTDSGGNAGSFNRSRPGRKLGVLPHKNLDTPVVGTSAVAGSNPEVALSFRALNHRDQRLANGGNQFSIEPRTRASALATATWSRRSTACCGCGTRAEPR